MLSFDVTQTAIVASTKKRVSWLFTVEGASTNYWSTKAITYGGNSHTATIIPETFGGITLNRSKSEINIHAPNTLTFSAINKNDSLSASDFLNKDVQVDLVVGDGTNEDIICTWKFRTIRCEPLYQELKFICEDFVQQYLEGYYPNTKLVTELSPSDETLPNDSLCLPKIFGTAYVPIRSVYVTGDDRYYVLGSTTPTYTIIEVREPRSLGAAYWGSGDYTFSQTSKELSGTTYQVFQPIIADSDNDGVVDAAGFFQSGDKYLDILTKFTDSTTSGTTEPEKFLEALLEDFSVPSADIDTSGATSTFILSGVTFASWGIQFNGGYFYKRTRKEILAEALNMCHSALDITSKIQLKPLSKLSTVTVTSTDVIRQGNDKGTFNYSSITQTSNDSGYIAYQESGQPQDEFVKILVPAKSSYDYISSDTLLLPMIQDNEDAQKLGILYYQRKFLKKANITFLGKGTLLGVQPDDVITINDSNYGGTYKVLVDSININRNLTLYFNCIRFKDDLDDWDDLAVTSKTPTTDSTSNVWSPVIAGPDSQIAGSTIPNLLQGRLRIGQTGNYITIDPGNMKIESGNYVTGSQGSGFHLSGSLLETGNIAARGMIRTAVFQYDVNSSIGGNLLITKSSDVLSEDMTAADNSGVTIDGNVSLSVNDVLRIKDGTDDEWMKVAIVKPNDTYSVTRDMAASYGAGSNPAWSKGAAVVNYGQENDGGLLLTASSTSAPYISSFIHGGSPWNGVTTETKMGNLGGSYGYTSDIYGFAAGEYGQPSKGWLTLEQTNGLRMGINTTVYGQWKLDGYVYIGNQSGKHAEISSLGYKFNSSTSILTGISDNILLPGPIDYQYLAFINVDTQYTTYYDIIEFGDYLVASCGTDGLVSFKRNAGGDLEYVDGDVQGVEIYRGLYTDDTFIYVACSGDGLRSYSINSDTGALTYIDADFQGAADYYHVNGDGSFVYAACTSEGIRSHSIDGSGNITYIDVDDQGGSYEDITILDSFIVAACGTDGVNSYSVDGGGNFTHIDNRDIPGNTPDSIDNDGSYIFSSMGTDGLELLSLDGGGNISFEDNDDQGGTYQVVRTGNGYIYCSNTKGMYLYSEAGGALVLEGYYKNIQESITFSKGILVGSNFIVTAALTQGLFQYIVSQSSVSISDDRIILVSSLNIIGDIYSRGDFMFNTNSPPTANGGKVMVFGDNTADPTMDTNTGGIFAKDVGGTVEMFAIDEADNAAQLTSHNFSLFEKDESEFYPWSVYFRNNRLGKEINVDMTGAIRAIEELSGKKFIYEREIDKGE